MGVNLWVTLPTAGRDTLAACLNNTGIEPERTVIVSTAKGVKVGRDYHVVADRGPVNIHRWWNRGIDYAQGMGATHVAVINDDAMLDPLSLKILCAQLVIHGATIASPGRRAHVKDPDPNRGRTLNGACWVLDLASGLRPDEDYYWWFGDDDLDWRARRDHSGVLTWPVPFANVRANELTMMRRDLQALAERDSTRWAARFLRREQAGNSATFRISPRGFPPVPTGGASWPFGAGFDRSLRASRHPSIHPRSRRRPWPMPCYPGRSVTCWSRCARGSPRPSTTRRRRSVTLPR